MGKFRARPAGGGASGGEVPAPATRAPRGAGAPLRVGRWGQRRRARPSARPRATGSEVPARCGAPRGRAPAGAEARPAAPARLSARPLLQEPPAVAPAGGWCPQQNLSGARRARRPHARPRAPAPARSPRGEAGERRGPRTQPPGLGDHGAGAAAARGRNSPPLRRPLPFPGPSPSLGGAAAPPLPARAPREPRREAFGESDSLAVPAARSLRSRRKLNNSRGCHQS